MTFYAILTQRQEVRDGLREKSDFGRYEPGPDGACAGASSPASFSHLACALTPLERTPLPPHHGQLTLLAAPPRWEITWPVPRQGIHSRGRWEDSAPSSPLRPRSPLSPLSLGMKPPRLAFRT